MVVGGPKKRKAEGGLGLGVDAVSVEATGSSAPASDQQKIETIIKGIETATSDKTRVYLEGLLERMLAIDTPKLDQVTPKKSPVHKASHDISTGSALQELGKTLATLVSQSKHGGQQAEQS